MAWRWRQRRSPDLPGAAAPTGAPARARCNSPATCSRSPIRTCSSGSSTSPAIRDELDLPADSSPLDGGAATESPLSPGQESDFATLAEPALGPVTRALPIADSLELGSATAMASVAADDRGITAIASDADFELIRTRLIDFGFKPDGEDLRYEIGGPSPPRGAPGQVTPSGKGVQTVRFGDGVIFVAFGTGDELDRIVADAAPLSDSPYDQIDDGASAGVIPGDGDCLSSVAISDRGEGGGKVIFTAADGEADADQVQTSAQPPLELGEPQIDGATATVSVDDPDQVAPARLANVMSRVAYDCG